MKNSILSPLVDLLTKDGLLIFETALEKKYILLDDLGRSIRPEIRQDALKAKTGVAVLAKFLKGHDVRMVLKEPDLVIIPAPNGNLLKAKNASPLEKTASKTAKKWVQKSRLSSKEDDVPELEASGDEKPAERTSWQSQNHEEEFAYTLYIQEVAKTPLLSRSEERELSLKKDKGDAAARELLITANLRLVVHIAKCYRNFGTSFMDLISEGNIGLMKGIDRYDVSFGAKISTYASWWIKQSIKKALANQSRTIRLPVHMVDKIYHMRLAMHRLSELFGREPTDAELAEEMGISEKRAADMRTYASKPTSIHASINEDDSTLQDVIADENCVSPSEALETETQHELLDEALKVLTPKEAFIIQCRFGLNGEERKTLEEISVMFRLTRERIRQIEGIALRKLNQAYRRKDKTLVQLKKKV